MNKNIIDLAEQAGFEFWGDEHWNPGDTIDWSSRYDNQFVNYAKFCCCNKMVLMYYLTLV
jgi:hypothetical protein